MLDMTRGNPVKLILSFALPLFIGNIFQQLYNVTDTFVVGRTLGHLALAALGGSSASLIFVFFGFASGLNNGLAAVTAQHFGAKDYDKVRRSIATSICICSATAIIITLLSVPFLRWMLIKMNTPQDCLEHAFSYLIILFIFLPLTYYVSLSYSILQALGDSRTPLYFLIFSNIVNIVLNVAFIRVFNIGVAGVAWATAISQGLSLLLCVIYSLKRFPILRLKKSDWKFSMPFYFSHLRMSIPMAMMVTVTGTGIIVINMAINNFGSYAVAGSAATSPLSSMTILPIFSLSSAILTYTAQNYGAKQFERIRTGIRQTMLFTVSLGIFMGAVMFLFAPQLVGLFVDKNANWEVIRHGTIFLRLNTPFYLILGILCVTRGILQGFGRPKAPFYSGVMEMIIRVFCAFVLTKYFGYAGACISNPLAWTGGAVVVVAEYFRCLKKTS